MLKKMQCLMWIMGTRWLSSPAVGRGCDSQSSGLDQQLLDEEGSPLS